MVELKPFEHPLIEAHFSPRLAAWCEKDDGTCGLAAESLVPNVQRSKGC